MDEANQTKDGIDRPRWSVKAPDPAWIPFLKMTFGFLLVLVIAILAAIIALGKVEQQTSFGLDIILGGLLTLTGGFAQWAFAGSRKDEEK